MRAEVDADDPVARRRRSRPRRRRGRRRRRSTNAAPPARREGRLATERSVPPGRADLARRSPAEPPSTTTRAARDGRRRARRGPRERAGRRGLERPPRLEGRFRRRRRASAGRWSSCSRSAAPPVEPSPVPRSRRPTISPRTRARRAARRTRAGVAKPRDAIAAPMATSEAQARREARRRSPRQPPRSTRRPCAPLQRAPPRVRALRCRVRDRPIFGDAGVLRLTDFGPATSGSASPRRRRP